MEQEIPRPSSDPSFNRACDACRLHKVRCLPGPSSSSSPETRICQRCLKTGRKCVFTAPQKRKQRKRTDTRVAELEREVLAMRTLFEKKKDETNQAIPDLTADSSKLDIYGGAPDPEPSNLVEPPQTAGPDCRWALRPGAVSNSTKSSSPKDQPTPPITFSTDEDVVEKGIISAEMADELFRTYKKDVCQHYPIVTFPPDTSSETIRKSKPTLFLAVIAAASAMTDPHLYSTLHSEVVASYAQRTVINGEKSIELVQALAVTAAWYYPPGKFSKLKFYEYIHMATTMGMDVGIGTNPRRSRRRRGAGVDQPTPEAIDAINKDDKELERRRTFIVCYIISTAVSMSMRRPNMIRYNSWVHECIAFLDANGKPECMDNLLIGWVTLLQIGEEITTSFSFDDPANTVNLAENHVQLMLVGFERKLQAWRDKVEVTGINDALLISYYHTQIFLHEIAMHDDHPPEDFQPPYRMEKAVNIDLDTQASSSYIESIAMIISNTHSLLDMYINMQVEMMRALPIYNFVRMAYGIVVLTKLHISSKTPGSHIGSVLNEKNIKLEYYLEALVETLGVAVGPMECRAPFTFLGLVMRLQIWYKSQEKDEHFRRPIELYGVLDQCWLPPPPKLSNIQTPIRPFGGVVTDESNRNAQLYPGMDANQIADIEQMGIEDLATMQPLPMLDIDFTTNDINQFLAPGMSSPWGTKFDMAGTFDWEPETTAAMQGVVDGSTLGTIPGTSDWESEHFRPGFM
ncbi:hypothetical protein BGZ60DRAFT_481025 [Tricladium varicosporioides]|nr:hypothetical protein BGZ60DRAFT_481025 [Hymenoscyphus varicosporioides]